MNEQAIELSLHPPVAMCTPPHPRMLRSIGFTRRLERLDDGVGFAECKVGWQFYLSY